jgi:hypothetical protein
MIEAMKYMYQLLLTEPHAPTLCERLERIAREAIAELESQEPDYWLGYGLQAHTEKPFDNATALYTHPPQRTEQNFCSRCGKRTNDIHTCTPPHD